MGVFFGGYGGKQQTSATYTTARTGSGQAYADRNSQAISGFQLESGASVTLTDQGAIEKAFIFADDLAGKALQKASDATAAAADAYKSAQQQSGAINADQLVKYGIAAVVLVVGLMAFGSRA
jgi:hypothetical protein